MARVDLEVRDTTAVLTLDSPPVNALSRALRGALLERLRAAEANPAILSIVITGAHGSFIAGADIREFDNGLEPPQTPDVITALDALSKPVVVAIAGNALGGGLEVALACDARIAAEDATLGFPEVSLGLIPGAGGTQRLPRVIGVERALELIVSGQRIDASAAAELGIIDEVVPADALVGVAIEHACQLAAATQRVRLRDRSIAVPSAGFFDEYRYSIADRARNQIAQMAAVRSVENGLIMPFDAAVAAERDLFVECLESAQSKAMRYAFFAERRAAKLGSAIVATDVPDIARVAVIGAGTMGTEITYCLIAAGYEVVLHDIDPQNLERATRKIGALLDRAVAKGRLVPNRRAEVEARLRLTDDLEDVACVDLVIEAVFEELTRKQTLFADLDSICMPQSLLATNTSTLDVDAMARWTECAKRVFGLHFFSPASAMRLIEIVRARDTADSAIAAGLRLAKRLGKVGVVVGNAHGFVGNRMFHAYLREAQALLLEGAEPADIDRVLRDWGMAMGPIAVSDLAGLDVGYRIRKEARARPDDPAYFRVADRLVEDGRLGQKTGRGHYAYRNGSRVPEADPEVTAIIAMEAARLGIERRHVADAEILERCVLALVIEGLRALDEGVARCASDIDVIWLNGYGFPRYRGGPMYYADALGLANVLERLQSLERRFGARDWAPPALLKTLVAQNAALAAYAPADDDVPPL